MRARFTSQARFEFERIFSYLEEHNETAATAVDGLIEDRIARLADFPSMAPDTDELGVQESVIVRYPYIHCASKVTSRESD